MNPFLSVMGLKYESIRSSSAISIFRFLSSFEAEYIAGIHFDCKIVFSNDTEQGDGNFARRTKVVKQTSNNPRDQPEVAHTGRPTPCFQTPTATEEATPAPHFRPNFCCAFSQANLWILYRTF
jgi:hypothetical protein